MHHYNNYISNDLKKCNLNSANTFNCLQYVPNHSECEKHRVEAIKIFSRYQDPITRYYFTRCPRKYSQGYNSTEESKEDNKIENVPTISEKKNSTLAGLI